LNLIGRIVSVGLLVAIAAEAFASQPIYPRNPVVSGAVIYASTNGVMSIDRMDLEVKWHALQDLITFEPVVTPFAVLVGSTGGVFALHPEIGAILWHIDSEEPLYSPTVLGDVAYVAGQDGSLRAVIVRSGRTLWQRKFEGWLYSPAIGGDRLVAGGSSGVLYGIETTSGKVVWEKVLGQELVYRPIDVAPDRVVVTTFDGGMRMISSRDGSMLWHQNNRVANSSPTVHDGWLYTAGYDGSVTVRAIRDGQVVWSKKPVDTMSFPPRVSQRFVIVGEPTGQVVVLDRVTGDTVWMKILSSGLATSPIIVDGRLIAFLHNRGIAQWPTTVFSNAQ